MAPPEIFREETSSSFEVGFKSRLWDNRIDLSGAIFQTDVDDMQFFEFFVGPFGLLRVVENIDEVSITGAELAIDAQVTENFNFTAGISVLDTEIDANAIRPFTVGNEAPNAPDLTYNLAATLVEPIGDTYEFFGRLEYSYQGDTWYHTVQDDVVPATLFGGPDADFSRSQVEGYGIANLRLGLEADNWRIVAFVRNLFDEEYVAEVISAPEFGGSFVHPGVVRQYGVELGFSFR